MDDTLKKVKDEFFPVYIEFTDPAKGSFGVRVTDITPEGRIMFDVSENVQTGNDEEHPSFAGVLANIVADVLTKVVVMPKSDFAKQVLGTEHITGPGGNA